VQMTERDTVRWARGRPVYSRTVQCMQRRVSYSRLLSEATLDKSLKVDRSTSSRANGVSPETRLMRFAREDWALAALMLSVGDAFAMHESGVSMKTERRKKEKRARGIENLRLSRRIWYACYDRVPGCCLSPSVYRISCFSLGCLVSGLLPFQPGKCDIAAM